MNDKPKKYRRTPKPKQGSISKATPETVKFRPKYIPLEKIRELIEVKELDTVQTAAILGCNAESIRTRCIRHGIKHGLKRWKQTKADILASKQRQLLESLDMGALKEMSPGTRVTAFGILFDKERLERGQSTANIAYNDYTQQMSEMDKEIEALSRELGDIPEAEVVQDALPSPEVYQNDDDFDFDDPGDLQVPDDMEDIDNV